MPSDNQGVHDEAMDYRKKNQAGECRRRHKHNGGWRMLAAENHLRSAGRYRKGDVALIIRDGVLGLDGEKRYYRQGC